MEMLISELEEVKFENVLSVGCGAFSIFTGKLKNAYMPKVKYMGGGVFMYCTSLSIAKYNELETTGPCTFMDCTGLQYAELNKLPIIERQTFSYCSSLTAVCTPNALLIELMAFSECSNLSTLVLSDVNEATELTEITSSYDNGHFYGCPHPVSVIVKNGEVVDKFMEIPKWNEYVQENQVIFVPLSGYTNHDILFTTVNGNKVWYGKDEINKSFAYTGNYDSTTQAPFSNNQYLSNALSLAIVNDTVGHLSSFTYNSFYGANNLSAIHSDSILRIEERGTWVLNKLEVFDCKNIKYIGDYAFYGDNNLTAFDCKDALYFGNACFTFTQITSTITLAEDNNYVTLLDDNNNPTKTGKVIINNSDGLVPWISEQYSGGLILPTIAKHIGDYAGLHCTNLTSVIGLSVEQINEGSFLYCSYLKSASFPNLKSIGHLTFAFCFQLSSLDIPNLEEIENPYSWDPNHIYSITYYCYQLSTISVADDNLYFSFVKEDNTIGKSGIVMLEHAKKAVMWASIPLCKNVVVPNDISSIAGDGFCRCYNMETITCNGIERLNYQSFSDCYKLNSIYCHNVKTVKSHAFRNTGIECQNVNVYMTEIDEPPECEADAFIDESSTTRANPICILVKDDEVVQKFIDNQTWKKFIDDGKITVLKYVPA